MVDALVELDGWDRQLADSVVRQVSRLSHDNFWDDLTELLARLKTSRKIIVLQKLQVASPIPYFIEPVLYQIPPEREVGRPAVIYSFIQ
jgi:hypothetical protein